MDQDFTCPITFEKYKHPIITPCGHTFERNALSKSLKTRSTCPLCNKDIGYSVINFPVNWVIVEHLNLKIKRDIEENKLDKIYEDTVFQESYIKDLMKMANESYLIKKKKIIKLIANLIAIDVCKQMNNGLIIDEYVVSFTDIEDTLNLTGENVDVRDILNKRNNDIKIINNYLNKNGLRVVPAYFDETSVGFYVRKLGRSCLIM